MARHLYLPSFVLCLFVFLNALFWQQSHRILFKWPNVPPAPQYEQARLMALGDEQLAYRYNGIVLQNMGSEDGQMAALQEYDYNRLKNWFFLEDALDPVSDFIPVLAAYYYGAVNDKEKLDEVLDYLAVIGQRPYNEKWRWLGHAVYLARHQQKDNDRALELAYKLAANKDPDLADWAKQMPAFILQAKGDSELAYDIMLSLLVSNADKMHPNEVFFMKDYICRTLLPEMPEKQPPEFCD
jgi:hypothetical protein